MTRRTAVVRSSIAALLVLSLAACSGDGSGAGGTTAAPTVAPSTAAPTTTAATTSTSTSTTLAPTTTAEPTTTTEALPVPAAAPDPRAPEPVSRIGSIEIPAIGVSKTMFEGVSLTVLDNGPGHWPGTAMPGHLGNVVVAGHRTSHDRPFRNIDRLQRGDPVIFTTDEGRFTYAVTSIEVVKPDAIWIINQRDSFQATLFACHPPGSTRERIVVHLRFVS